jgi:hypothetical protein
VIRLEAAWIALAVLSGCVATPIRGDAPPASRRADEVSVWSNLVRLPGPPAAEGYGQDGTNPWFVWVQRGDQIVARSARENPTQVDSLPFEAPIELAVRARGTRRSVVSQPNGWLVAMDDGEFGGGLYWVEAGTLRLRRLDSNLVDPIRWIGARGNRIVGVSGL